MTGEKFCEVEDVAESLAKGWGEIPKYMSDTRAYELSLLGNAYLNQLKVIDRMRKQILKKQPPTKEACDE